MIWLGFNVPLDTLKVISGTTKTEEFICFFLCSFYGMNRNVRSVDKARYANLLQMTKKAHESEITTNLCYLCTVLH